MYNIDLILASSPLQSLGITDMGTMTRYSLFLATSEAYGSSQARGQIGAVAAGLCHSHSNARFLTPGVRPGIKPESSHIHTSWTH